MSEIKEACVDSRVVNVYDVNLRTFVLKLNPPLGNSKILLLVESGIRLHMTKYEVRSSESQMPSSACAKLRAALRGKRISDVLLLGHDRVVLLRFGAGSTAIYLILELYATGNVVLTDADLVVTFCLRARKPSSSDAVLAIGQPYPATSKAYGVSGESVGLDKPEALAGTPVSISADALKAFAAFKAAEEGEQARVREQRIAAREALAAAIDDKRKPTKAKKKKRVSSSSEGPSLRHILTDHRSGLGGYGIDVIEDATVRASLSLDSCVATMRDEDLERIIEKAAEAPALFRRLMKPDNRQAILVLDRGDSDYVSFSPVAFAQHANGKLKQDFESFSAAVDEYFRAVADARLGKADESEKSAIASRVEKIRQDQARRVEALREDQDACERKAAALESRADDVDKILSVIESALSAGLRWDEIEQYVAEERERGSPLAAMITSLDLANRRITVSLADFSSWDEDDDSDHDDEDKPAGTVDVIVSLDSSAHASACRLWEAAKKVRYKAEKTKTAASAVVAAAEKQTAAQLAKRDRAVRSKLSEATSRSNQSCWWLKFAWFVSSDGYLCLCPREKSQFHRVLFELARPGYDAVVCAEQAENFPPCVVRGKRRDTTNDQGDDDTPWVVSPLALSEAGSFVACRSAAWTKRDRCATYWVPATDIRRDPPLHDDSWETVLNSTGDAFAVRSQSKRYLPPAILELSLAVLFFIEPTDQPFFKNRVEDADLLPLDKVSASAKGTTDTLQHSRSGSKPAERKIVSTPRQQGVDREQEPQISDVSQSRQCEEDSVKDEKQKQQGGTASKKKGSGKKKKGRRRDESDEDSNDDFSSKSFALDVCSRRNRRKQHHQLRNSILQQDNPGAEVDDAASTATETTCSTEMPAKALINGNFESTVGRLSATKRGAWDRLASLLDADAKASMSFELKFVADEMCDEDAVEALELVRQIEVEAVENLEARRAEAKAIEKRGGVPPVLREQPRNLPALLSGISRRLVNDRKKRQDNEANNLSDVGHAEAPETDDGVALTELTGRPAAGSELLDAVVVCAPTAATRAYAHALKLTPGNVKKGKAAKDAIEILANACPEDAHRERELIQTIDQNDAIGVLVANTKINASKLNALRAQRKTLEKQLKKRPQSGGAL